jgi:hypothetical protein
MLFLPSDFLAGLIKLLEGKEVTQFSSASDVPFGKWGLILSHRVKIKCYNPHKYLSQCLTE